MSNNQCNQTNGFPQFFLISFVIPASQLVTASTSKSMTKPQTNPVRGFMRSLVIEYPTLEKTPYTLGVFTEICFEVAEKIRKAKQITRIVENFFIISSNL